MIPNQAYDVIEIAKLQSAITGMLAGFALTVIILLIERRAVQSIVAKDQDALRQAAVMVFITILFTSTLASLLYAINGAEKENASRAFLLSVPPGFVFAVSIALLMYGVLLLLLAFKHDYVFDLAKRILWIVIVLSLFYYTFTVGDVIAVTYQAPATVMWTQVGTVAPLLTTTMLLPLCAFLRRLFDRRYRVIIPSRGFNGLMLACVLLSSVAAIPVRFLTHAPFDVFVPFWLTLLFIIAYSFLVAWLILFIPDSTSRMEEESSKEPLLLRR
jgi:hypothetical protein